MGCLSSKPKEPKGPAITGYTRPGSIKYKDGKGPEGTNNDKVDPVAMGAGTSRPVGTADKDDVILKLRNNGGSVKDRRKFETGEAANAEVKASTLQTEEEVLRQTKEREVGVEDVLRKSRMAEAKAKNEKAVEEEALDKSKDRSKDSKQLLRQYSQKVAKDDGKSEKVKELESQVAASSVPVVGYMEVETPTGIDSSEKQELISKLEAQEAEAAKAKEEMQKKIGAAANDSKHKTGESTKKKKNITQRQADAQQAAREQEEASFSQSIEQKLAEAKQKRDDSAREEQQRKQQEKEQQAAAKREAEEAAAAKKAAAAAQKAEEEEAARQAEKAAQDERLAAARERQEAMNSKHESATPWLAGSQQ